MRRDQTPTGSDYRRASNEEMWNRENTRPVFYPGDSPPQNPSAAEHNFRSRLARAAFIYREESGKDLPVSDWAWAEWVAEQGIGD